MAEIGWISIHRKIRECLIWDTDEPFDRRSAWIDLLMMANHEDKKILFNGEPLTVKMGQRMTSIRSLAERWHWSVNKVRRYLALLQKLEMVHKESDNKSTLLTIVNYGKYQLDWHTNEYTDEHTDGTPMNTQTEHRRHTNNNDNNDNNENNEKKEKHIYGEYAHVRLTDFEMSKLLAEYGKDMTESCITYLDEYIEMKGYKAKSHYLCIRKWVVDAVKERQQKKGNKVADQLEQSYEMLSKWAEEE